MSDARVRIKKHGAFIPHHALTMDERDEVAAVEEGWKAFRAGAGEASFPALAPHYGHPLAAEIIGMTVRTPSGLEITVP